MSKVTPEHRLEKIGALAVDLLAMLQPLELQPPGVRSAAVRLTVALAAVPPFEGEMP